MDMSRQELQSTGNVCCQNKEEVKLKTKCKQVRVRLKHACARAQQMRTPRQLETSGAALRPDWPCCRQAFFDKEKERWANQSAATSPGSLNAEPQAGFKCPAETHRKFQGKPSKERKKKPRGRVSHLPVCSTAVAMTTSGRVELF